jgi:hypothetical protein
LPEKKEINMINNWIPEPDDWETEPAFELELVRKGVPKGNRHFSFKQYLGWMAAQGYVKEDAKKVIISWNELNRPPIPTHEIVSDFERYWALWCKIPEDPKENK